MRAFKAITRVNGYRLRNLAEVEVTRGKRLCRGDSGAGVYVLDQGKSVLIGIVTGRLEGVGKYSPRCKEGNDLVTILSPYSSWLAGASPDAINSFSEPQKVNESLDSACKELPPGTDGGAFLDDLLEQYVHYDREHFGKQGDYSDVFLRCEHLDEVLSLVLSGALPVNLRGKIPPEVLPIVKHANAIRVIDANQSILASLKDLPNLRHLVVSGIRWRTDLGDLAGLTLQSLELSYGSCVTGLKSLAALKEMGVKVTVVDVKECSK